jgi:hypothetical protein
MNARAHSQRISFVNFNGLLQTAELRSAVQTKVRTYTRDDAL